MYIEQSHLSACSSKTEAFSSVGHLKYLPFWVSHHYNCAESFLSVRAEDSFKYLSPGWLLTFMKAFMNLALLKLCCSFRKDWNFPAALVVMRNWINVVYFIHWSTIKEEKPKPQEHNFWAEKGKWSIFKKCQRKEKCITCWAHNWRFFKGNKHILQSAEK